MVTQESPTISADVDAILGLMKASYSKPMSRKAVERFVNDPGHVFIIGSLGGMFFRREAPSSETYIAILFLTPEGRGAWGRAFVQKAVTLMFMQDGCERITASSNPKDYQGVHLTYIPRCATFEKLNGTKVAARWACNKTDWKV
jgi:hypothetical protein